MFGIPLVGAVWPQSNYKESAPGKLMLTKMDMKVLQWLQNKLMRVITHSNDPEVSTSKLLDDTVFL